MMYDAFKRVDQFRNFLEALTISEKNLFLFRKKKEKRIKLPFAHKLIMLFMFLYILGYIVIFI